MADVKAANFCTSYSIENSNKSSEKFDMCAIDTWLKII